jgi:hypothetical protein
MVSGEGSARRQPMAAYGLIGVLIEPPPERPGCTATCKGSLAEACSEIDGLELPLLNGPTASEAAE